MLTAFYVPLAIRGSPLETRSLSNQRAVLRVASGPAVNLAQAERDAEGTQRAPGPAPRR